MRTVNIGVASIEEINARAIAALDSEHDAEPCISFPTIEAMWTVLTPRRWDIILSMAGKGPMSLRAISRMIGKDVKNTHADVHALVNSGILQRSEAGFEFPYDAVHVEFDPKVKAA